MTQRLVVLRAVTLGVGLLAAAGALACWLILGGTLGLVSFLALLAIAFGTVVMSFLFEEGVPSPEAFCLGLRELSVDAWMNPDTHYFIKIGGSDGISQVRLGSTDSVDPETGYSVTRSRTDFFIADSRISASGPIVIRTIRRKRFPIFGRVTDVWWKGNDLGLGVVDRLNSELSLRLPLADIREVQLYAPKPLPLQSDSGWAGWMLHPTGGWVVPSRDVWDCYQRIARRLLETQVRPSTKTPAKAGL